MFCSRYNQAGTYGGYYPCFNSAICVSRYATVNGSGFNPVYYRHIIVRDVPVAAASPYW